MYYPRILLRLMRLPVCNSVHKDRSSFNASAEFWGSLLLAQQCEGFVGNLASMASKVMQLSMCFHSNDRFMHCPSTFDLQSFAAEPKE